MDVNNKKKPEYGSGFLKIYQKMVMNKAENTSECSFKQAQSWNRGHAVLRDESLLRNS